MQRNTGYFPTESLEPSGNRLFSRSALNEGDLFRGSLKKLRGFVSFSNTEHEADPLFLLPKSWNNLLLADDGGAARKGEKTR